MGAPKGNNYWQFRNKHGNNHSYTPDGLWDEAISYFEYMKDSVWNRKESIKSGDLAGTTMDIPNSKPMSISSFCLFADICEDTFNNYLKKEGYEDFFGVTKVIKTNIETQQFEGATIGAFNANIIARKLGLSEQTDITSGGEKIQSTPSAINVRIIENNDDE